MYSRTEIAAIKERYGTLSSWAIWDFQNENDISFIEKHRNLLHNNFVIIGLNISKEVEDWKNFHGGKHDRKLKYAFNSSEKIRGSYMTDLIKKVEVKSTTILAEIENETIKIEEHINTFKSELELLNITQKSKFIIFGNAARQLYDEYFEKHFPENKVYYFKHYSRGSNDKEWVEKVWKRLNINILEFETEKNKYNNQI